MIDKSREIASGLLRFKGCIFVVLVTNDSSDIIFSPNWIYDVWGLSLIPVKSTVHVGLLTCIEMPWTPFKLPTFSTNVTATGSPNANPRAKRLRYGRTVWKPIPHSLKPVLYPQTTHLHHLQFMVIMSAMLNACKSSPVFDREIKARSQCVQRRKGGTRSQLEKTGLRVAGFRKGREREFFCAHIPLHFSFERLPRRLGEVQKTNGTTIFLSSPFTIPLIIER